MLFTKEFTPAPWSTVDSLSDNPVLRVIALVVQAVTTTACRISFFYRVYSPASVPASSSLVGMAVVSGQTVMFHLQQYRRLWSGHWLPNSCAS